MIKKGMNIGDTFEDCGGFYRVTALDGCNYVSQRISREEYEKEQEEPAEQPEEEVKEEPAEQPEPKVTAKTRRTARK